MRQCTYCHQQGNAATRLEREDWRWEKVLTLMARMGGTLTPELRAKIPALFRAAYDPAQAALRLTADAGAPGWAPPPSADARRAVIEEWELGGRASVQHDVVVHPDGRLYSVDMNEDKLYRLDPTVAGGARESWDIPHGELPLGGVFARVEQPAQSRRYITRVEAPGMVAAQRCFSLDQREARRRTVLEERQGDQRILQATPH